MINYQIDVPGEWERIELIRRSVLLGVEAASGSASFGGAVSMASAELLENAIKHGAAGPEIKFTLGVAGAELVVRVENRVGLADETVETLLRTVSELDSATELAVIEDLFFARVLAVAESDDGSGDGLGLYRVAHEGRGRLRCTVDGSAGTVAVEAGFQLP